MVTGRAYGSRKAKLKDRLRRLILPFTEHLETRMSVSRLGMVAGQPPSGGVGIAVLKIEVSESEAVHHGLGVSLHIAVALASQLSDLAAGHRYAQF